MNTEKKKDNKIFTPEPPQTIHPGIPPPNERAPKEKKAPRKQKKSEKASRTKQNT